MRRWPGAWGAIAGAGPLVLAWWAYKLAIIADSQAGFMRTLGLFEVLVLGWLAVAALLALLLTALPAPRARLWAPPLFMIALGNAALLGFSIFYLTPRYAPRPLLMAVGALLVVACVRFVREAEDVQTFVGRLLLRVGQGLLLATLLPAPWVIADRLADHPHLPASPLVPAGLSARPDAPRRVVLVTFDALRARSTSFMDPKLDATPHLAAFAHDATLFSDMRAASDNTLVSLPTVLTGVRPAQYFPHIGNTSIYLRDGFLTGLGGFLAPAGYRSTYATMLVNPLIFGLNGEFAGGRMTSGMFRRNQFNTLAYLPLVAAFDWTRDKLAGRWDDEADLHEDELPATRAAFDQGLAALKQADGRAFVWIHVGVPHTPYHDVPAAEAEHPGPPSRYARVTERDVAAADAATLARYEQVYERYVRFGDAELGHFLDALKANKLYDDSLIIVTSDHGEEFGQIGHIPHGNGIATEDVSRVPLLIHAPGQQAPRREEHLVGHRDLVPTVLARVYTKVPEGLHGLDLLAGPVPDTRYLFTWAMTTMYVPQLKQAQTIAAYHGHFKYLERFPLREESLYDLQADPRAETNVARRYPAVLADLREHVRKELRP